MAEKPPPTPQKPRGLLLIMLSLMAVMILTVMMWKNLSPTPVPWSQFIERIDRGEVAKVVLGPEYATVTPSKKAGVNDYPVYYPSGRLTEASQKELNYKLYAYNEEATRQNSSQNPNAPIPIDYGGVKPAGFLSQLLPQL